MNNHPYHMVDKSPWPIMASIGLLTSASGLIKMFYSPDHLLMLAGMTIIILTMTQWWRDVIRESTFQGLHTMKVITSMKLGMMLFITSEILFFSSFFWAFFHSSLSPSIEIGLNWPPMGIKSFNPMSIPMLNTMILLTSGVTMTWAHSAILNQNLSQAKTSLIISVILGIYFSMLQGYEYWESSFCISDSIYGATFFMSTGFHGIHVIIGTWFIFISMMRLNKYQFSNNHHVGFECSAWYWHFVDVVWLFLYITIYWWGS